MLTKFLILWPEKLKNFSMLTKFLILWPEKLKNFSMLTKFLILWPEKLKNFSMLTKFLILWPEKLKNFSMLTKFLILWPEKLKNFSMMGNGGGIITRKLLFAVLLVASMSLVGIAGVSAASVGTAPTQTGNHHTVQKDINLHVKDLKTLKKPIKTQKKVVKKSKSVKKTVNHTNTTTQYVNTSKTAISFSKNSVKTKNNTVTKSVPKYAYGEKPKYAYGHKKYRVAHKWYRYHGKWYRYHGKVHKYKKTHRYHRYSSANSSSIKALANSLSRGTHSQYQKGARIFNWVRNNLRYSFYYNTRLGAAGALKYRKGNCADTTHLVVALARSSGLQAKYAHGKVRFSSGRIYGHVWAVIKANGRWYTADASSNRNSFGGMKGRVVRFQGYHNSLSF